MITMYQSTIKIALQIVLLISLTSCYTGTRTVNSSFDDKEALYDLDSLVQTDISKKNKGLLILSFSGGGTRAAALSYGVLKQLRDTEYQDEAGSTHRFLDDVDIISSVSGGSFTAAYYGLFGDQIFDEFETIFLRKNVQSDLIGRVLNPFNWFGLISNYFDRTSLAVDYYDKNIFKEKTFADLYQRQGPEILINATDLSAGARINFNQIMFTALCSDILKLKIAYAVAASSAVPVLFSPVSLKNFDDCTIKHPGWFVEFEQKKNKTNREIELLNSVQKYFDKNDTQYLHLVDGGISDNLGLRSIYEAMTLRGGIKNTLRMAKIEKPEYLAIVVVNAEILPLRPMSKSEKSPSTSQVMNAVTSIQIQRYNAESITLIDQSLKQWADDLSDGDYKPRTYLIQLGYKHVVDEKVRKIFQNAPTSFALKKEEVDKFISAGQTLLENSPEYLNLVEFIRQR